MMRALLTIEAGYGEPRVVHAAPGQSITLGRHRNNTIVLRDEHASRWHAEVFHEQGQWFIRDFNTVNRTRINGEAITAQVALVHDQLISSDGRQPFGSPGGDGPTAGPRGCHPGREAWEPRRLPLQARRPGSFSGAQAY